MELNGETFLTGVDHALIAAVIRVPVGFLADTLQALSHHGITVILAGNVSAGSHDFTHGLVCTAMTVFQLHGLAAHGKRSQLMAKADAKDRNLTDKLTNLFNAVNILCGIAGAV